MSVIIMYYKRTYNIYYHILLRTFIHYDAGFDMRLLHECTCRTEAQPVAYLGFSAYRQFPIHIAGGRWSYYIF